MTTFTTARRALQRRVRQATYRLTTQERVLLPMARPLSTSGGHYNSIGVFTTTRWLEADYSDWVLLPVFLRVEG